MPPSTPQIKQLLTEVINTLILISAGKVKLIFKQNIQIISTLISKWKTLISINKNILAKMLSIPDTE